jgi:hypothetical protein
MTVSDLMMYHSAKNHSDLGRKMNKNRSVIKYWVDKGIPERTQALIELQTSGQLKAAISTSA